MSRLFTIFDIHGRNDLLQDILEQLHLHYKLDLLYDKLIFTGDYLDRGPDSKGVLDTIISLQTRYPESVIALKGNHETLAINACVRDNWEDKNLWHANGGGATTKSYGHPEFSEFMSLNCYISPEHLLWLAALPTSHEEPGFFFSHAPVPKDELRRNTGEYSHDELTWTYFDFVDEKYHSKNFGDKVGVCGHIHRLREGFQTNPRMYDHYIFGDTGAGCSKKAPLTCVEVVSREIIQAWPKEKS